MTSARDVGLFLLMAALFGGAFPAIEVGLEFFPPLLLAAVRYDVSGVLLLAYALASGRRLRPATPSDRRAVAASGVFVVGGTGFTFLGLQYTTGGVGAIVVALGPVLTVAVAWLLLPDQQPSRRDLVALGVGLVGVAIVAQPSSALGPDALVGNLLVLAATVSIAVGSVLVRRVHPSMSVLAQTGWAMLGGGVLLHAASVAVGEPPADAGVTLAGVAALAYLAVLGSAVGFTLYFSLLARFGPLQVNLVTYVVPIVATAVGWLLLDEPVTANAVVGFGVVLVGFLLLKNHEIAAELAKYRAAGGR